MKTNVITCLLPMNVPFPNVLGKTLGTTWEEWLYSLHSYQSLCNPYTGFLWNICHKYSWLSSLNGTTPFHVLVKLASGMDQTYFIRSSQNHVKALPSLCHSYAFQPSILLNAQQPFAQVLCPTCFSQLFSFKSYYLVPSFQLKTGFSPSTHLTPLCSGKSCLFLIA